MSTPGEQHSGLPKDDGQHDRFGRCAVAILALAVCAAGCSTFSAKGGSLADYEDARRSIENPVGVYRPEGISAEKRGAGSTFLDRIGLATKRRRDIELARSLYKEADELFEKGKTLDGAQRSDAFRAAAEKYQKAADNWQSSGLEQDALMMAGEALFFAEDYYRAEQVYASLVKEYPRNPYLDHIDSRRFEIADYWLKVESNNPTPFVIVNFTDNKLPWNDTGGHGKRVLERMRLDNPTGKVGDDATMRLAMESFEQGNYEAAADTFADLRLTYPDSEHQFNAHMLELQSLLASYQGPAYSSIPITDAQDRLKQIVKQFPQQAAANDEVLQEAYAKTRFAMAERIWTQAKYRRSRDEHGSAKYYYQRLLTDYADTPFADQAREAMAELKDAPDAPPQRFKALIWMLGGDDDDRPWQDDAAETNAE